MSTITTPAIDSTINPAIGLPVDSAVGQSLGSQLYDGAASLGQLKSKIGLYIALVLSVIAIGVGIYLLVTNQDTLVDGYGTITTSTCVPEKDPKGNVTYSCQIGVDYVVRDKMYSTSFNTVGNKRPLQHGEVYGVTYDTTDPSSATSHVVRNATIGYTLIGIGVLVSAAAYLNYYFTSKSKLYAAASGTAGVIDIVSAPFK